MGLCKCPKRKVTNLFCFEHRVNVCEHCLVENHTKCIVKSYLQWLQDSDYNPVCTLCNRGLADEECGGCVRLTCYDVFHWQCLNYYAQRMPAQTAPAGYTCPICSSCIFPQSNMASPVSECLKSVLQQVNWARAGLGLPLIEETEQSLPPSVTQLPLSKDAVDGFSQLRSEANLDYASGLGETPASQTVTLANGSTVSRPSAQVAPYQATPPAHLGANHHSVISVDDGTTARGMLANPRKLFDSTKEDTMFGMSSVRSHDHDEDKYKRRPALQWLGQWFNSVDKKGRRDPNAVRKRYAMIVMLGIIGFITIVIIFSKLGRQATEDDPFFDPMANPNIKVEKEAAILH